MAGLVPAIHALLEAEKQDVDARDEPGHDGEIAVAQSRGDSPETSDTISPSLDAGRNDRA
jgi:hypothetical protein